MFLIVLTVAVALMIAIPSTIRADRAAAQMEGDHGA